LLEELVDEGGFPVVDVSDDGDVAQLHRRSLSEQNGPVRGKRRRAPGSNRAEIDVTAI
jgi:hypothetical protein